MLNIWQRWLHQINKAFQKGTRRASVARSRQRRRPVLEALEDRTLPSVTLINGQLTITGDDHGPTNDKVVLRLDTTPGLLDVVFNGTLFQEQISKIKPSSTIHVNTKAGDDSLTIDSVNGNPIVTTGGLSYNGGTGNNTLIALNSVNTWDITGSNTGKLNSSIHFVSVGNLTGGTGNDAFTFETTGKVSGKIDGGSGGVNTLDYSGLTGMIAVTLTKAGTNLGFQGTASLVGSFDDITKLVGSQPATNDNTLTGPNSGPTPTTTWDITGTNSGDVDGTTRFTFSHIDNLTGGTGDDTFAFATGGSVVGKIDGGTGGVNTLDYSGLTSTIAATLTKAGTNVGFQGTASLVGGFDDITKLVGSQPATKDNTLSGPDSGPTPTTTWDITGTNSGDVDGTSRFAFSNIENLTGGTGDDTFTVASSGALTGTLTGGTGTNTLVGPDGSTNLWAIQGADQGTLTVNGTLSVNQYKGIGNLTGGTGDDTFQFAVGGSVSGTIDGGLDPLNTLDYSGLTSTISVTLIKAGTHLGFQGTASLVGAFDDIDNLIGSLPVTKDNTLTGPNSGPTPTTTWNLTGSNSGDVDGTSRFAFSNIDNLTGGTGDDSFIFTPPAGSVDGKIDGGTGGINTLDYSGLTGPLLARLQGVGSSVGFQVADNFGVFASSDNITALQGTNASDTLTGLNQTSQWSITATDTGKVTSGGHTLAFQSVEKLTGGTGDDSFAFTGTGSEDGTIDGGAGGTNTLDYSALTSAVSVILTGAGTSVGFKGTASAIGVGFDNITQVIGSLTTSAQNQLTGTDQGNLWTITGSDSGTVASGTTSLAFSNIGNLKGGILDDTFTFNTGGSESGIVDGGTGGANTLDYSGLTSTIAVSLTKAGTNLGFQGTASLTDGFDDITNLIGSLPSTKDNTLTGPDSGPVTPTSWDLTGPNSGDVDGTSLFTFANMDNLTGGTGDDKFIFFPNGSVDGAIKGGTGANTLDYSNLTAVTNGITVDLTGTGSDVGFQDTGTLSQDFIGKGFDDITNLVGTTTPSSGLDTLIGPDLADSWTLSGTNSGSLTNNGSGGPFTLTFASIENLTGGSQTDTFTVSGGSLSGLLDGGAGSDVLNDSGTWNITGADSGNAPGVVFQSIENLVGGPTDDKFVFSSGGSISGTIDGGTGGSNTLDYSALTSTISATLTQVGTNLGFKGTASLTGGFDDITNLLGSLPTTKDNTLTGPNSGPVTPTSWDLTGPNSGNIDGTTRFNFTNMDNLTGGTGDDKFIFFIGSSVDGTIKGGTGANSLDYSNLANVNAGIAVHLTGTGSHVGFQDAGTLSQDFIGKGFDDITNLVGTTTPNSGFDTLIGPDLADGWAISGTNSGTLTNNGSGGSFTLTFASLENLTGGSQTDTFTIGLTGVLSGLLDGAGGTDKLIGSDNVNVFDINGANSGSVTDAVGGVAFANIENLTGGSNNDDFIFQPGGSISGAIDGGTVGSGFNTLSYANLSTPVVVNLSGPGSSVGFQGPGNLASNFIGVSFDNISRVIGSASNGDTLTGTNLAATWTIDQINGSQTYQAGGRTLTFSSLENLNGGSDVDTFFMMSTNEALTLHGGGGDDMFVAGESAPNQVVSGGLDNLTRSLTIFGDDGHDLLVADDSGATSKVIYNLAAPPDDANPGSITSQLSSGSARSFAGISFFTTVECVNIAGTPQPDLFTFAPGGTSTLFTLFSNAPRTGPGSTVVTSRVDQQSLIQLLPPGLQGTNPIIKPSIPLNFNLVGNFSNAPNSPNSSSFQLLTCTPAPTPSASAGSNPATVATTDAAAGIIVTGAGAGSDPLVHVYDAASGKLLLAFEAFDPNFRGGVEVAVGNISGARDANNSPVPDIIVAAGPGGGPQVKVISGQLLFVDKVNPVQANGVISDSVLLGSFMAFDPSFRGGVTVAAGDVNDDGFADVIVGAGPGGGPHVKVIDGRKLNQTQANGEIADSALLMGFMAYDTSFHGGVFVAAGDVNGDGFADVVTGAGPGGGPHVKAFSGVNGAVLVSFMAFGPYNPSFHGGVNVGAGLFFGSSPKADIVVGEGPGGQPIFEIHSGEGNGPTLDSFFAYDPAFSGGIRVGTGATQHGFNNIITGAGPTGGPHVKYMDPSSLTAPLSFFAFSSNMLSGVDVAGGI
jgi:acrosin